MPKKLQRPRGRELAPVVPFPAVALAAPRERLLEAMLLVSGELRLRAGRGPGRDRAGRASRATFYKHFEDNEDCFAQAYHDAAEWLYQRLIGVAKRQPTWREGLRAAHGGAARVLRQPAGDRQSAASSRCTPPAALRLPSMSVLMERLSRAIDGARREIPSRQAPPPVTATFMVGAIETLVRAKLMSDEPRDRPGDAPRPAPLRGHAVLRRGRRLGRDDRGAPWLPGPRGARRPRRIP